MATWKSELETMRSLLKHTIEEGTYRGNAELVYMLAAISVCLQEVASNDSLGNPNDPPADSTSWVGAPPSLVSLLKSLVVTVESLPTIVEAALSQENSISIDLSTTHTQLDTIKNQLDFSNTQLDSINAQLDSTDTQLTAVSNQLGVVSTKLTSILDKLVNLDIRIQQLQEVDYAQNNTLNSLKTCVENLKTFLESTFTVNLLSTYRNNGLLAVDVIKASPGTVRSLVFCNGNLSTRYLQFFNSAATPAALATATDSFKVGGGENLILGQEAFSNQGLSYSTGITFGLSTTPRIFTIGVNTDVSLVVKYL